MSAERIVSCYWKFGVAPAAICPMLVENRRPMLHTRRIGHHSEVECLESGKLPLLLLGGDDVVEPELGEGGGARLPEAAVHGDGGPGDEGGRLAVMWSFVVIEPTFRVCIHLLLILLWKRGGLV